MWVARRMFFTSRSDGDYGGTDTYAIVADNERPEHLPLLRHYLDEIKKTAPPKAERALPEGQAMELSTR